MALPLVMNFVPAPQDQTFVSAQKHPEVVGDVPYRAAVKIGMSGSTFPVHASRWNPGSPYGRSFNDYSGSWCPAAVTQDCNGTFSCWVAWYILQISVRFLLLNIDIWFFSFLLCLSFYIPVLNFCYAVCLPNTIALIWQNTTALKLLFRCANIVFILHMTLDRIW